MGETMKIDYSQPLTEEQAEFAASNHNIIYSYLNQKSLPIEEFYGLAAIGLVRAVQAWFQSPYVRTFKFSTIAGRAMRTAFSNEYRSRQRHTVPTLSMDHRYINDRSDKMDKVWEGVFEDPVVTKEFNQVLDNMVLEDVIQHLSEQELYLLTEVSEKVPQRELSDIIGVSQVEVSRRLKKARRRMRSMFPELKEVNR